MRLDSLMIPSRTVLLAVSLSAFGFFLVGVAPHLAAPKSSQASSLPEIIFVQAPKVVAGVLAKRFPKGSRLVRLTPGEPTPRETCLTPEFFSAADPEVSADGTRVLFSGRENAEAHWQIWEMKSDGSGKRQVTRCSGDCLRPAYLPRNRIVYTGTAGDGTRPVSTLFVSLENGQDVHPITFGPGNFQVETVLRDGRILASADSPLVANHHGNPARLLYTIRPDGTGLSLFRPNQQSGGTRSEAEELDDGAVLFVVRNSRESQRTGGELAWIRPGALHNSLVTPRQPLFWSANDLHDETLIVAKERAQTAAVDPSFDLYTFNLARRAVGELIYRHPQFSSVQPAPVKPHSAPKYYWSILHPQAKTGRVICLNSYLSGDAPGGRIAASIARVRVIMLEQNHESERVLGEAPVEKDGSFYVEVPADVPIRFELLSASGDVIRAQRSWVWARGGEDMGCAGCHDDKASAPPNHWPQALNRFDTPIAVGVSRPSPASGH